MREKVLLGVVNDKTGTYADGEELYLEKHSWDCEWYWGFGYVGNKNCHFHFTTFFENNRKSEEIFKTTKISESDWWVIRDLFKQAYSLRNAAETYKHGGRQTYRKGLTDILKNPEKEKQLNDDLKLVLDTLWDFVVEATK